ncbi:MAG: anhydro-N-acetylmuramic acid kinase [Pseudomonadales bacterium]
MSAQPISGQLFVGAISGTSVDGLDLALLKSGARPEVVRATTKPLPDRLRLDLLAAGQPGNDDLDLIGSLDRDLGLFIGEAVLEFLNEAGCAARDIQAIGSHGQTVRHRPFHESPFTWQIGDPNLVAETTGITTIADFRRRDMAAGGQGAPLVPLFHEALFRTPEETRVVVNIGGIGNISVLPKASGQQIRGFDTGPGNGLMDSWCALHEGTAFDAGGRWAATGRVLPDLLERCLADDFFRRSPPKSTGREQFNLAWLNRVIGSGDAAAADVQRTLLELTAVSITDAITAWSVDAGRVILCGGGRHNDLLRTRIADHARAPVIVSEDLAVDGDSIEAATFAWLAMRRLAELTGNAPSVTGARGSRILGAIYPP